MDILVVTGEVLLIVEGAITLVTLPLSLVLVELEVKVEFVLLYKPLATDGAHKRPLFGVELHMLVEIAPHSACE